MIAPAKKGDQISRHGITWTVLHVTVGGEVVISVRSVAGADYSTTISADEWRRAYEWQEEAIT